MRSAGGLFTFLDPIDDPSDVNQKRLQSNSEWLWRLIRFDDLTIETSNEKARF